MATGTINQVMPLTEDSNITFNSSNESPVSAQITAKYTQYGRIVQLALSVKNTTVMASGSGSRIIASVPNTIPRPYNTAAASTSELNAKNAYYYSDGTIRIQNNSGTSVSANSTFDLVFIYLTA